MSVERKIERISKRMETVVEDLEILLRLEGGNLKVKEVRDSAVALKDRIGEMIRK